MRFVKMNGAGNDFIILDNRELKLPHSALPQIARTLCERHLSIGADGLMAVEYPQGDADYRMLFYNADGSAGEMCGNGARCICRYGHDNGLAGETQVIETPAGIVTGERIDPRNYRIRLNDPSVIRLDYPVTVDGVSYDCAYVELGNPGLPHAVVPMQNLVSRSFDELRTLGAALRSHPAFPKGANVNFCEIVGCDRIVEKTYERGVEDFTYACGTGTGSVVAVLTLKGLVSGSNVRVQMAGGELRIDAHCASGKVEALYLTGPTNLVCTGEILDEELKF